MSNGRQAPPYSAVHQPDGTHTAPWVAMRIDDWKTRSSRFLFSLDVNKFTLHTQWPRTRTIHRGQHLRAIICHALWWPPMCVVLWIWHCLPALTIVEIYRNKKRIYLACPFPSPLVPDTYLMVFCRMLWISMHALRSGRAIVIGKRFGSAIRVPSPLSIWR